MEESTILDMSSLNEALPVFRFKFMPDTINELNKFAKIHKYDPRDDFKQAWEEWIDNNDDIINNEVNRLKIIGYKGDVVDKMYKSVRYYYRKKPLSKQEPTKRKKYFGIGKNILKAMDNHIDENQKIELFTPAMGYNEFCNKYIDLLREYVEEMSKNGFMDAKQISDKVKKTYKNRYFRISRNMTVVKSEDEDSE